MNVDWIIKTIEDRQVLSKGRGDHDLNPGMGIPKDLKAAAVLMPLIVRDDSISMLFTERTDNLSHHPGQISFPGGRVEPADNTPKETALRETEEEVGIHHRHIQIIGQLDNYWTRTGFSVTPLVGIIVAPFSINPDPNEVANVFEVPLDFLMDPSNHKRHSRTYEGSIRHFYAITYKDFYIWGATAGMLIDLYGVLIGK